MDFNELVGSETVKIGDSLYVVTYDPKLYKTSIYTGTLTCIDFGKPNKVTIGCPSEAEDLEAKRCVTIVDYRNGEVTERQTDTESIYGPLPQNHSAIPPSYFPNMRELQDELDQSRPSIPKEDIDAILNVLLGNQSS